MRVAILDAVSDYSEYLFAVTIIDRPKRCDMLT
jgi:hypothetical protein